MRPTAIAQLASVLFISFVTVAADAAIPSTLEGGGGLFFYASSVDNGTGDSILRME